MKAERRRKTSLLGMMKSMNVVSLVVEGASKILTAFSALNDKPLMIRSNANIAFWS
jgi:hypothetical protein